MIPTQPGIEYPFTPDNTWRPDPFHKGWHCPSCGQYIGDAQYHNCPGPTVRPVTTTDRTNGGAMSEFMMYGDFKKLLRNDTVALFRERFLDRLVDLGQKTPADSGDANFEVDAIMDVFDEVAKGINNNTGL